LARLARDRNDRNLEEEELRRIRSPVEGMLNVVLSTHGDLAGEIVYLLYREETLIERALAFSAMTENPDVVSSFLSFCSQVRSTDSTSQRGTS